jgi:choline-sulfatase
MPADHPNVVFVLSDQHRAETTGCYGSSHVDTPNVDALADRGTRYENAYCTSPLCGPSRASFFTGTHPHTNGLVTHPNGRHRSGRTYRPQRRNGVHSLIRCLQESGYRTHGSGYVGTVLYDGERSLQRDEQFHGFDSLDASTDAYADEVGADVAEEYRLGGIEGEMWEPAYFNVSGEPFPYDEPLYDTFVADRACRFLEDHSGDDPFCLYVGFRNPHPPWCAPEEFHADHDPDALEDLPDWQNPPIDRKPRRVVERHQYFDIPHYSEEMVRRSLAAYHATVSYTDHCVGRILDTLDRLNVRENTIVVYLSDHGENAYRHGLCEKHTFYEDAVQIPLIVSYPGVAPEGLTSDSLVSIMDVLPTVLSLTDTPVPDFVEGRDIRETFYGESVRDAIFAEYYHSLDPCRMIRTDRYKYVHTEEDIDELYDLEKDPDERHNLAWYPAYRELVEEFEERVHDGWEIPDVPIWGTWNDLNERKQQQRLAGLDIENPRPDPPEWVQNGPDYTV